MDMTSAGNVGGGAGDLNMGTVAGQKISYSRFHDDVLASNAFLAKLTELLDNGILAGSANLAQLRKINPQLRTFQDWLAESGRVAFLEALCTSAKWDYGHN